MTIDWWTGLSPAQINALKNNLAQLSALSSTDQTLYLQIETTGDLIMLDPYGVWQPVIVGTALIGTNIYRLRSDWVSPSSGVVPSSNKPWVGMAAYCGTLPQFPRRRWIKQFPTDIPKPFTNFLPGSFLWDWATAKLFCNTFADRPHMIEIYLSNGPGRRRGPAYGAYYPCPNLSISQFNRALENGNPAVTKELKAHINKVLNGIGKVTNPNTILILCPELEDNLTDLAYANFSAIIKTISTAAQVRNAIPGNSTGSGGDYKEAHDYNTNLGKRGIFNNDGCSIGLNDGENFTFCTTPAEEVLYAMEANYKNIFALCMWTANGQGLANVSGFVLPPPYRRQPKITDQAIAFFPGAMKRFY